MSSSHGFWKPGARSVLREDGSSNEVAAAPFNFSSAPLAQQRLLLPIHKHRRHILYAIEEFHVLVIVGETGCGKCAE